MDQTLRMWVKTLNPSWSDPSPHHNQRALKVPTLRASLGITGPPLTGFPANGWAAATEVGCVAAVSDGCFFCWPPSCTNAAACPVHDEAPGAI